MKIQDYLRVGSVLLGMSLTGPALAQLTVYDNLAGNGWNVAYPTSETLPSSGSFSDEFGDEIMLLANTPRTISTFTLQYYVENLSGNINAQIRFYQNDGTLSPQGFPTPNTLLYDSGSLSLAPVNGNASLTLNNLNVTVPDSFTWTVQFSGLSGSDAARSSLNSPQSVGLSYDDFWQKTSNGWSLYQFSNPGQPGSFGASVSAVPEPGATAWVLLSTALTAAVGIRTYGRRRHS